MQTTRCRQYHRVNGVSTAGVGLEQGVVTAKDNGAAAPGYSLLPTDQRLGLLQTAGLYRRSPPARHAHNAEQSRDVIGADSPATHQSDANAAICDWGDGMKHEIAQACSGGSKQRIRDSGE